MRRRRQAEAEEEEERRSAEDGRASAIGAAPLKINPSGRAGEDRMPLALKGAAKPGREGRRGLDSELIG